MLALPKLTSAEVFLGLGGADWTGQCNECNDENYPCQIDWTQDVKLDDSTTPCHLVLSKDASGWTGHRLNGSGLERAWSISFRSSGFDLTWQDMEIISSTPLDVNLNGGNLSLETVKVVYKNSVGIDWPGSSASPLISISNGSLPHCSLSVYTPKKDGVAFIDIMVEGDTEAPCVSFVPPADTLASSLEVTFEMKGGMILGPSTSTNAAFIQSSCGTTRITFTSQLTEFAVPPVHHFNALPLLHLTEIENPRVFIMLAQVELISASTALVDDRYSTADLNLEMMRSRLTSPTLQRVLPLSHPFIMNVRGNSVITAHSMNEAFLISSSTTFINCEYRAPFTAPGEASITIVSLGDGSVTEFKHDSDLGTPSNVLIRDTLVSVGSGSTFKANNETKFAGDIEFGSSDFGCSVVIPNFVSGDTSNPRINTRCDMYILESCNMGADSARPFFNAVVTSSPAIFIGTTHPYSATFNLQNFSFLSVAVDPNHPPDQYAVKFPTLEDIEFNGRPMNGFRIDWPPNFAPPPPDVNYLLLPAVNMEIGQQDSYVMVSDLHQFLITTYPSPSLPGWFDVSFRYVGPNPSAPPPPTGSPIAPFHSTTPSPPTASSSPGLVSCPRPPPGFICAPDGSWISNGSINTNTSIVFLPGVVVVTGNLTLTHGALVLSSDTTNVTIAGCINLTNGSSIIIDLNRGKGRKSGSTTHITQSSDCPNSLINVPISVRQRNKSCEKGSVRKSQSSTRDSLTIVFAIDNSACDTKWIILGAVLGGVIVLGAIAAVVICNLFKKQKIERSKAQLRG